MPRVTLRTAYCWWCETCGRENFSRAILAELNDADREAAYRMYNQLDDYVELPDDWRDFQLVMQPQLVTCPHCATTFTTQDDREGDLDGD